MTIIHHIDFKLEINELIASVDKGRPKTLYEFHENLYSLELNQVTELIKNVVADDLTR